MATRFIRSKRFIHNSNSGLTLVELLVAMLIAFIVLGMALQIAIYNRKLYLEDQVRNTVNQNLRAAIDIVGTDVKQAGEQIPDTLFPVITIQQDNTDVSGVQASELVIRRNLIGTSLPVCKNINAGSNTDVVFVAGNGGGGATPPGCNPIDNDGNGWPDNLDLLRNYRLSHGGQISLYIYDGNGNGEFFTYNTEDNSNFKIHKANNEHWQYNYNTNGSRIYLMEERRYRLCQPTQLTLNNCSSLANGNNVLQLVTNGTNRVNLVNALTRFQVQAFMQDDSVQQTFPAAGLNWSQIKAIRVGITSSDPGQNSLITTKTAPAKLHISQVFFPRNILSQ